MDTVQAERSPQAAFVRRLEECCPGAEAGDQLDIEYGRVVEGR